MKDRKDQRSDSLNNLYLGGILLLVVILIGIVGYRIIEGYSFVESLFMVIITIATVGYSEVKPLSEPGMYFSVFLIISSLGIFGYVITSISRFVIDGGIRQIIKKRKLSRRIQHMEGHVIVCGYGRNGKQCTIELMNHHQPFIVIEQNEDVINRIREDGIDLFIHGDATHDDVLERAGIARARALITTFPNDADNTFVVLTARSMNPKMTIISRAYDDHSDVKLKRAGATNVIMPDKIGGIRMAKLVVQPDVVEFVENILLQTDNKVSLEEINGRDISPDYLKGTIKDLEIRTNSGASIMGIKTETGEYIFNPSPETHLSPNDKFFVLGSPDQIDRLKKVVNIE
jgi:voltage-gated potassium channel